MLFTRNAFTHWDILSIAIWEEFLWLRLPIRSIGYQTLTPVLPCAGKIATLSVLIVHSLLLFCHHFLLKIVWHWWVPFQNLFYLTEHVTVCELNHKKAIMCN